MRTNRFHLSCFDATAHHSRKMDRALGLMGKLALKVHLLHCPNCTNATASMDLLRKAMREIATGETPHGDRLVPLDPSTGKE